MVVSAVDMELQEARSNVTVKLREIVRRSAHPSTKATQSVRTKTILNWPSNDPIMVDPQFAWREWPDIESGFRDFDLSNGNVECVAICARNRASPDAPSLCRM